MATTTLKRKASSSLQNDAEWLQIDPRSRRSTFKVPAEDDGEGDVDMDDNSLSSDGEGHREGVDTPLTPFSPVRKKFPSEYKTHACTFEGCMKMFNRPARLTAHMRSHTNERPYICTYEGCDKTYLQDKHLQHHIKSVHTRERDFICDYDECTKSFLTSTRLKRHKETHIGHERFKCRDYPPCNQTFRKHNTLQRHIRSDHLDLVPYPCPYLDPFTGQPCNAGFDGAVGLRQHVQRIHGPVQYFCPDCTLPNRSFMDGTPIHLSFPSQAKLEAHIKKEHAKCVFCEIRFTSNVGLQNHIETQHSGKSVDERKTIPCTYEGCYKKFTKRNNLNAHIRSAHEGARFICGTFDFSDHPEITDHTSCGEEFVAKKSLIDHILNAHINPLRKLDVTSTAGINDFMTDDWDLDFSTDSKHKSRRAVAKHQPDLISELVGTTYMEDPRRTIKCEITGCPYKFMRQFDLDNHMATFWHMDPAEIEDSMPNVFETAEENIVET